MAVHIYAMEVGQWSPTLAENGDMTFSLDVCFLKNDNGTLTTEQAGVAVTFDPDALMTTIEDAITDAVVAFASATYSLTLPRNHFIFATRKKGVIV